MRTAQQNKESKQLMRSKPTLYELEMKLLLKKNNIEFKQQMILGFYILDFVVPSKMLVIEVDGEIHSTQVEYDRTRDRFVKELGFVIIRVKNEDVSNFDTNLIHRLKNRSEKEFRRALSQANIRRGRAIIKMRKQGTSI